MEQELVIGDNFPAARHCGAPAELKFMIYDGGWGESSLACFFQCGDCGVVVRGRVSKT